MLQLNLWNEKQCIYSISDALLISRNPFDFPMVSQGEITVKSIDDVEEFIATDVSTHVKCFSACLIKAPFGTSQSSVIGQLSHHHLLYFSLSSASDFVTKAKLGALSWGDGCIVLTSQLWRHSFWLWKWIDRFDSFIVFKLHGTFKVIQYCRYYIAMVPKRFGTLVCHEASPGGQWYCVTTILYYCNMQIYSK